MLILKILACLFAVLSFMLIVSSSVIQLYAFYGNRKTKQDPMWWEKKVNKEWYEAWKEKRDKGDYSGAMILQEKGPAGWCSVESRLTDVSTNLFLTGIFIGGVAILLCLPMGGKDFARLLLYIFLIGAVFWLCSFVVIGLLTVWLEVYQSVKDLLRYFRGETKQ